MIVAGLIFVMAGAIGWLLVAWLDTKGTLTASQESVSRQTRAIELIRHKKDSALARLAIAESKLKVVVSGPPTEKQSELPTLKEGEKAPIKTVTGSGDTPQAPQKKYRQRPSRRLERLRCLTAPTWMLSSKRLPRITFSSVPALTTQR